MHLKQLKLVGFKSFVDVTIVPFPSQLVAIVGPNGCGKSNIIDAVRWVMGESSAKNLRGESMTDVIFNGSSQRKAVGQAFIELTFDNSLGRLTGQYASYQEIAVKRVVSRDGESAYFLNGSRCRRRDITDIFLGTGAGSRGYSIIGQGTISRIIEARPEELRTFFEEASGISKYKERRRETLTRIENTRENLIRLADLRDELGKQLQRLERQAKTAKHYSHLKATERRYKTEVLALKWGSLTKEQHKKHQVISQLLEGYEKHQANAAEAYNQSEKLRVISHDENESMQQIQANFYQLATEIARMEEGIQQYHREKLRLENDQQQLQNDWQQADAQLKRDKESLIANEVIMHNLQSKLEIAQQNFAIKQRELEAKQQQQNANQQKNNYLQAALSKSLQEAQIEQLRLQHLEESKLQLSTRHEKIIEELAAIDSSSASETFENLHLLQKSLQEEIRGVEEEHQSRIVKVAMSRQQLSETEKLLHQSQDKVHRLYTQQAGLAAAQRAGLGIDEEARENRSQWIDKPRLVEHLQVEKKWQLACEFVLSEALQAVAIESMENLWPQLESLKGSPAHFISLSEQTDNQNNYPRLADKIQGAKPKCLPNLDKIYVITSLEEALLVLPNLKSDESLITEEGYWLAKDWLKFAGSSQSPSLIIQQEELSILNVALLAAENELAFLKNQRDVLYNQVEENDQLLEYTKQKLYEIQARLHRCETELAHINSIINQETTRKSTLSSELELLLSKQKEQKIQLKNAIILLEKARHETQIHEQEQQLFNIENANFEQNFSHSRLALEDLRIIYHQSQLEFEKCTIKNQELKFTSAREALNLQTLSERLENLALRLIENEEPDLALKVNLEQKITQQIELENALGQSRERFSNLATQLSTWEDLIKSEEKLAKTLVERIQLEQMQEQALMLQANVILESLAELDAKPEAILETIPEDSNTVQREAKIADLASQIKQLGAINLAAIEEYRSEYQRKSHLDDQYQDLSEALNTLDSAIEKMDKETKQRLKITFDQVNIAFQALFPRLFGGGRAMLELTGDNLLEAGVVVMAQPPGKRNSTIHLLSGGEKAMTAVALVFAIFQLNPSPFCMLDEVDAPLDDVNVRRFCDLVKEMSQVVQFLFITHNKVTMELADHLIGVTMREPGVSRIVAVDVEEALAMAEA
ncbi:MAG: chromosome segregation protein SMC [Tatlockia sp.]|nr:chromosome segregation protein SMC [Tatlockia sp.]